MRDQGSGIRDQNKWRLLERMVVHGVLLTLLLIGLAALFGVGHAKAGEQMTTWRAGDTVYLRSYCRSLAGAQQYIEMLRSGTRITTGDCYLSRGWRTAELVEWISGPHEALGETGSIWRIELGGAAAYTALTDDTGPHLKEEVRADMARKAFRWYGKRVTARMRQAQVRGINEVMAASVVQAKQNHEWQNRTGTLEGGIGVVDYAHDTGKGAQGLWGVADVAYAAIHELGGVIRAKSAKALHFVVDGEHVVVKQVTMPARPYLRPAADEKYPDLAPRIRKHFEREQHGGTGGAG